MQQNRNSFNKVDVLLVDTDLNARQGVRTILSNNGFSEITLGTELSRVREAITRRMPDILLVGTSFPDGDVRQHIHAIRHNKIGNNPFMPIIVLLDQPTPEFVTSLMAAGPDDVVMKPVSTKGLLERLHMQIYNRKPYIVTESYVGPARKGDDTSRAIAPPNPIRDKVETGKANFMEVERGIENALTEVGERRLENQGPEIAALVGRLGPMLDKPVVNQAAVGGLRMLIEMNEDMIKKLQGTRYDHVSELCKALVTVSERLCACANQAPDATQVKLLKPLSQAIQTGFSGGINDAATARMIVERIGVK